MSANITTPISNIWQGTGYHLKLQWNVHFVRVYLQYGHLIPQLALLLGGKAKLVYDFDSYVPPCLPVLS